MITENNGQAVISIHAPRTGSDADAVAERVAVKISIHAPRTGSDMDMPGFLRIRA